MIGSGSSGVAKKVRNKHTGGLLVLKVIQFNVSSDTTRKQVRERGVQNEAGALAV